jgi:large subunit ribosomal protein L7/L12
MADEVKKPEEAKKPEVEAKKPEAPKPEAPKAPEKPAEASKPEAPKEPKKDKPKKEVPAKFKKLVEEVEKMSVLELSELVKALEDRFGVSAQAPVAMVAGGAGGEGGGGEEEKTEFDVELTEAGGQKIAVIKVVREITGKGLKDAKDIVDSAPKVIKEKAKKEEAEEIKKKIETAGGKATLK